MSTMGASNILGTSWSVLNLTGCPRSYNRELFSVLLGEGWAMFSQNIRYLPGTEMLMWGGGCWIHGSRGIEVKVNDLNVWFQIPAWLLGNMFQFVKYSRFLKQKLATWCLWCLLQNYLVYSHFLNRRESASLTWFCSSMTPDPQHSGYVVTGLASRVKYFHVKT